MGSTAKRPSEPPQPGFFGKLPMRGDFVARRIDGRVRGVLDDWLSACLATAQRALGSDWAVAYEHAPPWRFLLAAGIAGPNPLMGILAPSVDTYGRRFPIVIAVDLPGDGALLRLVDDGATWFAEAEQAVAEALSQGATLDGFDARVSELGLPALPSRIGHEAARSPFDPQDGRRAYVGVLESLLSARFDDMTVWWTLGGGGLSPSLLHHRGLPTPHRFAALIDGRWDRWDWAQEAAPASPVTAAVPPVPAAPAAVADAGALHSAARSHRGTRSNNNQDAALERADLGLWAVADGAGGHDHGAYASAVVIDKLAELQPALSFPSAMTEIEELLGDANDVLRAKGRQLGPERLCAAVMVALFVHAGRYAVVWAGDSRAYLSRDGRLQRLTRDHVTAGGYVTRAIGAEATLHVDVARGEIRPGDRFVLCSDGLVKTISDRMLEAAVQRGSAVDVAAELIDDALISGAGDNVTALVVDVVS